MHVFAWKKYFQVYFDGMVYEAYFKGGVLFCV